MASRVWCITGCSSGFGRELALQALQRGDKVIATARNVAKIEDLKEAGADTFSFDITASVDTVKRIISDAFNLYGRIDVLVNNAGYVQFGGLEETSHEETLDSFNANVFGPLNVIRAIAPYMRSQRSGVIANVSSILAWSSGVGCGLYSAPKWAFSGITETLYEELKPFGVSVISVEPGLFRSNLLHPGNRITAQTNIAEYDGTTAHQSIEGLYAMNHKQPGDPAKGAKVMIDVLTQTGSATGRDIPMRLGLGADAPGYIGDKCRSTLELLEEWKDVSTPTDHSDVK